MASLLLTVLLVCMAARWAEGAAKELNQPCTPGADNCVHFTLETVCDQEQICKIKQGQACDGDGYSTLCVAGAECDSGTNVCTCKGPVYSNDGSTGKCSAAQDKYGGACLNDGTCTAGSNLECVSGACLCTQSQTGGLIPNLADGTCTAVPAVKAGKSCTAASEDTDCGVSTYLLCVGAPLECGCFVGFAGPRGGDCAVIAQQLVGRRCDAGTESNPDKCGTFSVTSLECTGNSNTECACTSGYYGVRGGACHPASGILYGRCEATSDCTSANTACMGTPKKCQCAPGSVDGASVCIQIPAMKVGRTCDPNSSPEANTACGDPAITFLECPAGTTECACKTGFEGNAGEDCVVSQQRVGRTCDPIGTPTDADKCGPSSTNLECPAGTTACACTSGYLGNRGEACTAIPAMKVGRTCDPSSSPDADTACGAPATTFLECPSGTTECACKSGFEGDAGEDCVVSQQKVGRTCDPSGTPTDADKCGSSSTNLECPSGTTECACTSGYMGNRGEACSPVPPMKVGRTCDPSSSPEANTACGDPGTTNLECPSGTTECACKSGYGGSKGGDCSKNSGAVELVGSLVTVTLAAVLHVFMRH